ELKFLFITLTLFFKDKQLHFQIHHQNKLHSFYDTFTMESHEVQHHLAKNMTSPPLEVIPEDRSVFEVGDVISAKCPHGTIEIDGKIECKQGGRIQAKHKRESGK
ncbi:unnamed protein product, partial [Allacma fusca]